MSAAWNHTPQHTYQGSLGAHGALIWGPPLPREGHTEGPQYSREAADNKGDLPPWSPLSPQEGVRLALRCVIYMGGEQVLRCTAPA